MRAEWRVNAVLEFRKAVGSAMVLPTEQAGRVCGGARLG